MKKIPRPGWLLLIISLPSNRATPRMRAWRALKGIGAAVLRDGVYLLPQTVPARRVFQEQARAVAACGGMAQVLPLGDISAEQERYFHAQFDRSHEYARILEAARKLKVGITQRNLAAARRTTKRLQRDYEAIRITDHFAGAATTQTAQLLTEVEALVSALASPDEPRAQAGAITRIDRRDYRGRLWATRARPWVDRLASAWLIKRYIDPRARIVWLKDIKRCPRTALGFDFDGATFTHVGARVTFEVLLASFDLEDDAGLVRMGQLVHQLDVGGVPVAEAAGVAAILQGMRHAHAEDNQLLAAAGKIFDHLYQSYTKP